MIPLYLQILLLLSLIILNGVFAGSEIAIVSAKAVRLRQKANEGKRSAQTALQLADDPNRFLSTVQVVITLIGIVLGAVGGAAVAGQVEPLIENLPGAGRYSQPISVGLVVVISTYLSLVLGELVPKRMALGNPERFAMLVAQPMKLLSQLALPFVNILSYSTAFLIRVLGMRDSDAAEVTEDELSALVREAARLGEVRREEQHIVERVFQMDDWQARMFMTPRGDVVRLDINDEPEQIIRAVVESKHTYFPVIDGDLDKTVGFVSVKGLFEQLATEKAVSLEDALVEPLIVPENILVLNLLQTFKTTGMHVALVFNEFGGAEGIITLHDVMEAMVGEIADYEKYYDEPMVIERDDGSLLIDGLMPVEELESLLDVSFKVDAEVNYQTLGGFVMAVLGQIPISADVFTSGDFRFEVVDMDGKRVDKVLVSRVADGQGDTL